MIKRCANSECSKMFVPQGRNRTRQIYCCTECKNKVHYRNNKERRNEYAKEYYKNNKKYIKEYLDNNKEHIKEYKKKYNKKYSANNKERMKEYGKEYYRTHPIRITSAANNIRAQHNRRARERNAGGTYTEAEYIAKGEAYGWKCRYCGIQLSYVTAIREHSIPLARGGDNCIDNIFPSCQTCNNEKYMMTGIEYMTYRMRRKYLARRK